MSGNANSGRRPKPVALKLYEGNRGKRPLEGEPQFRPTPPQCPDDMPPDGRLMWDRLLQHFAYTPGMLVEVDWLVMELACDSYSEYAELRRDVRANGRTYEALVILDANGTPVSADAAKIVRKARPEVLMLERARRALDGYLGRLGISPADRARLHVPPPLQNPGGLLDA